MFLTREKGKSTDKKTVFPITSSKLFLWGVKQLGTC